MNISTCENEGQLAKSSKPNFANPLFNLQKFSQLRNTSQAHVCHFPTSKSNFAVANQLAKSSKPNFASSLFNLLKFSQAAKHLLTTRVPFRNFKIQFRSCKSSYEPTSEMDQLVNQVAKSPPTCENANRRLNFYLNLLFSHFLFCTATLTCEKALQLAKPKNFRGSPPKEAQKSCV